MQTLLLCVRKSKNKEPIVNTICDNPVGDGRWNEHCKRIFPSL
ncbi:hypothetical protein AVEN_122730-1, partial [Araneus ventricosus]